jgi:Mg2+ and Co2+ transporter CorA
MRTLVASLNGTFRNDLPLTDIDRVLESRHNIVWLDIQDPTEADQIFLREEFGFHPLAIEDAIRSHERPKVDAYGAMSDRDLLSSALDSYLSLQSNRLNEIVKVLTIASIILMADALVTGFYGQNFKFFPELGWPIGSFWSLLLIAVVTIGLIAFFRRKKWL